jgi:hypothetical protein
MLRQNTHIYGFLLYVAVKSGIIIWWRTLYSPHNKETFRLLWKTFRVCTWPENQNMFVGNTTEWERLHKNTYIHGYLLWVCQQMNKAWLLWHPIMESPDDKEIYRLVWMTLIVYTWQENQNMCVGMTTEWERWYPNTRIHRYPLGLCQQMNKAWIVWQPILESPDSKWTYGLEWIPLRVGTWQEN